MSVRYESVGIREHAAAIRTRTGGPLCLVLAEIGGPIHHVRHLLIIIKDGSFQGVYDQDSASHSKDADQKSLSFIVTRYTTLVTTYKIFHYGEQNDDPSPHGHWVSLI